MADGTKIEWTDATWNPITGCSVVSPGCTNCYAMKLAGTRLRHHPSRAGLTKGSKAGPVWTGEVRLNAAWLDQPLRWKRPREIFVCAHGDLFAEGVPDEWIDQVFAVMALAPQHTFQVLTKRPERMCAYLTATDPDTLRDRWYRSVPAGKWYVSVAEAYAGIHPHASDEVRALHHRKPPIWPLPNVWLGVSVEDQTRADQRRIAMAGLADQRWLTWVSYEPALGPVDWTGWNFLRWLVAGGESGADARPSHPDWHRAARDFCAANSIAFLFKQWGEHHPSNEHDFEAYGCLETPAAIHVSGRREHRPIEAGHLIWREPGWAGMCRLGKARAGRLLDGREHNDRPQVAA